MAKGGDVTLHYDGTAAGTGRVEATQPMIFSAGKTTDIGYESGTTVSDLGHHDHDHFIDPDERLRIAMARQ